jgi:hypothetical protein
MTAYTNVIVSLIALITSMIIHRNYAAPAVLFAILAQAITMANSMRTNPRNWHHDFARGFPTLGHNTPDLPYELLASAERLTTCPDPHETCLKVAITNIGTWSKYVVVKYKYLVSPLTPSRALSCMVKRVGGTNCPYRTPLCSRSTPPHTPVLTSVPFFFPPLIAHHRRASCQVFIATRTTPRTC